MRLLALVSIGLLLSAAPAAAESPAPGTYVGAGTLSVALPLTDVLVRARGNASLQLQIRLQLHRAQMTRDDVWCRAVALDARWGGLAGEKVGPYVCPMGRRTLHLSGAITFQDARGNVLSMSDPSLPMRAVKLQETAFKWRWSNTVGVKP